MAAEYWMPGMWVFPVIMPIVMIIVLLIAVFLIFGQGRFRPPLQDRGYYCGDRPGSGDALEILKKRYARGEITKEEFVQMKQDILA